MGLTHGLYCLGCCAVLMGLLFVGGVMNLIWVAALTLLVAIEKLAPFGAARGEDRRGDPDRRRRGAGADSVVKVSASRTR